MIANKNKIWTFWGWTPSEIKNTADEPHQDVTGYKGVHKNFDENINACELGVGLCMSYLCG